MSLGWPVGRSHNNKPIKGDADHCCTNLVERGTQPQQGQVGWQVGHSGTGEGTDQETFQPRIPFNGKKANVKSLPYPAILIPSAPKQEG